MFSDETQTEAGYDFITITNSLGRSTEYDGDELAGETLYLPGDHFTINLRSDSSVNEYGFSFTDIQGVTQAEYEEYLQSTGNYFSLVGDNWPESQHDYESDSDITWDYAYGSDAYALRIVFSPDTQTEDNYDYITITDSLGESTQYSGTGLAGRQLILPGNRFTIRLTSDGGINKYGFALTEVAAITEAEYDDVINTFAGTCGENITW